MNNKIEQTTSKVIKSTIQKFISNISIIAIVIALVIIAMAYAGLTFDLAGKVVWSIAVPTILLAIANITIYELWLKNGISDAREEKTYVDLLKNYMSKSSNINNEIMQEYIVAEKQRRYKVEYDRLTDIINTNTKLIEKLSEPEPLSINKKSISQKFKTALIRVRIKCCQQRISKLTHTRDNIIIDMPYSRSEQFDQLRYSVTEVDFKEYKPNDTKIYLSKKRIGRYTRILMFTIIGINSITIAVGGSGWLVALFMTLLSAVSITVSLVMGFNNGYTSIAVSSTGVYNTAISFIDKADAYCTKHNKSLRYIKIDTTTENKSLEPTTVDKQLEPIKEEIIESQVTMNIFDKI